MRSFASALSLARGGRSDNASVASAQPVPPAAPHLVKSRSTSLFAKAPKTPVETATSVLTRPLLTPGSSCSSEGSASLQTPEDDADAVMPPFPKADDKKRWSSWFGWRRPLDKETDALGDPAEADRTPAQAVSASKVQDDERVLPRRVSASRQSASDSDSDEQSSSDSSDYPESSTVIVPRSVPPREAINQARANLRTLLRNTLCRPPSPPPLVETPSSLFPRSCTSLGSVQQALSLESTMHVRKLLWRLDHRTLSDTEVQSILSLARRPQPKETSRNRMEKRTDDDIISYASMRVGRYSRGLRKWAYRPCFEQRFLVWMPDDMGNIGSRAVMGVGRGLAVCELEFSEGLEALAGLELDDETFEQIIYPSPPLPKKPAFNPKLRRQPSLPSTPRKSSFHRAPSPLRLDHSVPAEPVLSTVSPLSSVVSGAPVSSPILDVKSSESSIGPSQSALISRSNDTRSVLEETEYDESIPLGYAIQAKKRREEKARFLQAERERRAKEIAAMEREKHEIEQRRALEEQRRREDERRRIEEEKRAREERMRERYNEEITASRQRRESARLGMESYNNIRQMHQRENARTYSRPTYDPTTPLVKLPRRSASDFVAPGEGSRVPSIAESSQDKRRSLAPPSITSGHSPTDNGRPPPHRRQSTGTDAYQQQQQQQPPSRPSSIASSSSRPMSVLRTHSAPNQVPMMAYPMMPVMPQMPPIPVVPSVPVMSIWNMPLLPPNAPFMMQQYSRSPSPGSPGSPGPNPHSRNHSPSPSYRQSGVPPPSPSRRQSGLPPPSPSQRQSNLHSASPSPSHSHHADSSPSRPTRSRVPSGDSHPRLPPGERRGSNGVPQRPSRSTSYSTLQQSISQTTYRDDRPQKPRQGSSTNLAPMDSERRTSLM